ncbi:DnaB-like helicase N-terminal domain-containing protein [Corynebacterium sanguinis]|uniref:GcrE n=1 Tax=Corynebacterium sanguinis TaxID=2594913 RepID=A0A6C1TYR9_9CORY|nr:DnaB-like helicase N-terminal domain-containing protein [Corynebacterium sanguinis]TVS26143.1 GcrE [Corynebacterium sanguinis]
MTVTAQPPMPDEPSEDVPSAPDMSIDAEALLLCALLWMNEGTATTRFIVEYLDPKDFYNPAYGRLFAIIAEHLSEGGLVHPATIAGRISQSGTTQPWPGRGYQMFIADIVHLNARPEQAHWYAEQVLATSYRRQFHRMAEVLVHTAEHAPEDALFETLLKHGRSQRAAWKRRTDFAISIRGIDK